MKTNVYSLDGKSVKQIELPVMFSEAYREDLIKRAVLSDESKEYQPKGAYRWAGLETSAKYRGRKEMFGAVKNKGIPHLPHEVLPKGQLGKVKRVPHSVKGRRAHPPKPEKKLIEKINKKEYAKALRVAVSASSNKDLVSKRHHISLDFTLPLVLDNSFENLKNTKEIITVLNSFKLNDLLTRSKEKGSKGALVVVTNGAFKSAQNIAGFEVVSVNNLKARHLAPGCRAGRLLIVTENSLKKLEELLK